MLGHGEILVAYLTKKGLMEKRDWRAAMDLEGPGTRTTQPTRQPVFMGYLPTTHCNDNGVCFYSA